MTRDAAEYRPTETQTDGRAMPGVPEGEGIAAFISAPDFEQALPSLATVLAGPPEVNVPSFLFSPGVIPASVLGYALGGDETLNDIEDILVERAERTDYGKISKYDSFYFPQTPVPFGVWEYKCSTCRFYQEGDERTGEGAKCSIIGLESDWFGGENVHPSGWCAQWLPYEGVKFGEYISNRVEGELPAQE
jgi:hypothetical protein